MMFRSAKALDRAKTHSTFKQAMASYEKTAETWYDGSVDAVDRRIAAVDKLLHHIRTIVARLSFADSASQLRAAQTLSADRATLVEFKRTLLTGAADYSTWANNDLDHSMDRTASKGASPALPPSLPAADRRWVTLESSRFVSANTDCLSDPEELGTRAEHHAALKTSTFSRPHSAAVTRAFVAAVIDLGRKQYRPPVVKQAAIDMNFKDEAMFL
jgi:hypothetical protein